MPETTVASLGFVESVYLFPLSLEDGRDYHLGYSIASVYDEVVTLMRKKIVD